MAVAGIGGVGATPFVPPTISGSGASGTAAAGGSKGNVFAEGLKEVQAMQDNANTTAGQLATGELTNIHDFTTAAAKAQLGIQLTAALRNKAVEAYQEIMRMQV